MKRHIYFSLTLFISLLFIKNVVCSEDVCNSQNPNYCFECKDENKRDFTKCGEVDYRRVDFGLSERIYYIKNAQQFSGTAMGLDFDPYTKKAVYCANIGKDTANLEIFIANAQRENDRLIINDKTKKRITWDSIGDRFSNIHPILTKTRKIAYKGVYAESGKKFYYLIDQDGSNKEEISEKSYFAFFKECHDKDLNFNCPLSK